MNKEKLHKILDLVLELNEKGYTTFYEIAGHVETIHVRVYEGRWRMYKPFLYSFYAYTNKTDTDMAVENTLDEIIETLEELKGETK